VFEKKEIHVNTALFNDKPSSNVKSIHLPAFKCPCF